MRARRIAVAAVALVGLTVTPAHAADPVTAGLLDDVAVQYRHAVIVHDTALAARLRTETRLLAAADPGDGTVRLARTLRATRDPLHPWPLAGTVEALAARAGAGPGSAVPARPYTSVRSALDAATASE